MGATPGITPLDDSPGNPARQEMMRLHAETLESNARRRRGH